MASNNRQIIKEAKYSPPYPQDFHAFWPSHAIKSFSLTTVVLISVVVLAYNFSVPVDSNMPPLPDEGANIPAPEWYLFLLFQPFWYLTGENTKWLSLGTFWLPLVFIFLMFMVPVLLNKPSRQNDGSYPALPTGKKTFLALGVLGFWMLSGSAVVGSGYPAKTTGCASCHNPMMGVRQALPPASIAEYYRVERARQIKIGKYNAGKTGIGIDASSYKDANWQLRHFYEPTMTW